MINRYSHDRCIPASIWNNYLQKYADTYRTQRDGEDCLTIRCRKGHIIPNSILKETLFFTTDEIGGNGVRGVLQRLDAVGGYEVRQRGDGELSIVFPEARLAEFAVALGVCRRRRHVDRGRRAAQARHLARNRRKHDSTPMSRF